MVPNTVRIYEQLKVLIDLFLSLLYVLTNIPLRDFATTFPLANVHKFLIDEKILINLCSEF